MSSPLSGWARLVAALYRRALVLYPPDFRRSYGEAMVADATQRLSDRAGTLGVLREGLRLGADLLRSVPRERLAAGTPGRPTRSRPGLDGLAQDLRYAIRTLRSQAVFSTVAILTLALGIGAATSVFSVAYGVLLRPLPYDRPEELIKVWPGRTFSKEFLTLFGERLESAELAAYSGWGVFFEAEGGSDEVSAVKVSGNTFDLLGIRPLLGRGLQAADARPGAEPVVVLAHDFWLERFGGDRDIVGRTLPLQDDAVGQRTVVGVLPPGHYPPVHGARLWFPMVVDPGDEDDYDGSWYLQVIGRVRDRAALETVDAEVATIAESLAEERFSFITDDELAAAGALGLREFIAGDTRPALVALLSATGLLLLIACVNVAHLSVVRAVRRRQELALRSTLGAGRTRILRQLLTEGAVLGLAGGALGTGLSLLAVRWLRESLPADLPRRAEVAVDPPVLLFALAVSLGTVLVFGLLPALRTSRTVSRPMARAGEGAGGGRLHGVLIATEVALAVALVAGSGLVAKSVAQLHRVDPGFAVDQRVSMRVSLSQQSYDEHTARVFWRQVVERLRALPGVREVGGNHLLLLTSGNWNFPFEAENNPVPPGEPPPSANYRVVTPGYFRAIGQPLLQGRVFDDGDRRDTQRVVVINEAMARSLWPGGDPLGRWVRLFRNQDLEYRVVGVVGDVRQHRLDLRPEPEMYYTVEQRLLSGLHLVAHVDGDPDATLAMLRSEILELAPTAAVTSAAPLRSTLRESLAQRQFIGTGLSVFSLLALGLGAFGVYGIMSFLLTGRLREFGVRLAVGARRADIRRSALLTVLPAVALGIAAGLAAASAGARLLGSLLFEVSSADPTVLGLVALALLAVALAATWVPAARAARLDPMEVLRSD